jgi:pSer/pThr/pTyr-binding forkhead associated (FHA) protein
MGSSNGTHINRVTIERARLRAGDILEIGMVPFRVRTAKDLKLTLPISLARGSARLSALDKRNAASATVLRKPVAE